MFVQVGRCAYLPGRQWALATRLAPSSDAEYRALLETCHRRSGPVAYRPVCRACAACRPIRVEAAAFRPSRSQRRSRARNLDLAVELGPLEPTAEKVALHDRFVRGRFETGEDQAFGSVEAYAACFGASPVTTIEMRYRLGERLVAVGIVDLVPEVVSSVYFYFDPDPALARRSLGVASVLEELGLVRSSGRRWLYLGYWVAGCATMAYKARYRPCELLDPQGRWRPFDEVVPDAAAAGGPSDEED